MTAIAGQVFDGDYVPEGNCSCGRRWVFTTDVATGSFRIAGLSIVEHTTDPDTGNVFTIIAMCEVCGFLHAFTLTG